MFHSTRTHLSGYGWLLTAMAVLLLGACAPQGDAGARSTLMAPAQQGGTAPINTPTAITAWWEKLNDQQLNALQHAAQSGSPTLHEAEARIRAALAVAGVVASAQGPRMDGYAQAQRGRSSYHSLLPPPKGHPYATLHELGVSAGYDFDLWGRISERQQSAMHDALAARAEQAQAGIVLSASICAAYFALQDTLYQQEVIRFEQSLRDELITLRSARHAAGLDTRDTIAGTRAEKETAERQVNELRARASTLRHQLAALTGQSPEATDNLHLQPTGTAPQLPIVNDLTLDLLGTRPDVAARRLRVEAASHNIAAAKADFYPSLKITALAGYSARDGVDLFRAASGVLGIAPALTLPIFHAGELQNRLREQGALYDVAVERYNATVLDALRDVADRYAELAAATASAHNAAQATRHADDAYGVAQARYEAGTGSRMDLITRRLQVLALQRQEQGARTAHVLSHVALYKALGSGYETFTPGTFDVAGQQ